MTKKYPKVLILGPTFNKHTGTGITLSNLFKNWPSKRLFVATSKRFADTSDFTICDNYYQMGYKENKMQWPSYYFQPKYNSGLIDLNTKSDSAQVISNIGEVNKFKKKIRFFYNWLNLDKLFSRLTLSNEMIKAIEQFEPDILYTHLDKHDTIFLTKQILTKFQLPLVIHIMDDWPSFNKIGFFNNLYFSTFIAPEFKSLLKYSSMLFSISEYMSEEYFKRYGYKFIPFQNCIEYKEIEKKAITKSTNFVILYAGRIGIGTSASLLEIAKAVERINIGGGDVIFEIQTIDSSNPLVDELKRFQSVKFVPRLPYAELEAKLASVDLLLLPIDFDKKSLTYLKLSMPTKVPEYLLTGVPVLVFSPAVTALVQLFKKYELGYVVTEEERNKLSEVIKMALTNQIQNEIYLINASKYVQNNKDCKKVRSSFQQILSNVKN